MKQANSFRASKIARRTRCANIIILSMTLVLVTIITFLFIASISGNASRNLALSYSMEAAEIFHSYLVQDLVLIQKEACSNALVNWFIDEKDNEKKEAAYYEVMDYTKIFQRAHLYFGIHKSLDEYSVNSTTAFADFIPLDRLDPLRQDDAWYFECIGAGSDYILSINNDKDTNTWQLWINHKVMANGSIAGVIGSGLPIQKLIDEMFARHNDKDFKGYVVDKHGKVLMDSAYSELYGGENEKHIHDVDDDPALVSAIGDYLKDIDSHFSGNVHAKVVKLTRGVFEHASIAPVVGSDWSVVIFYNNKLLNGVTDIINLLPLLFFMMLSLLLYVIGGNTLMKRLIFTPLFRLTQSVSESKTGDSEIFGNDRDDEIGELSRTIRDMRDSLNNYISEFSLVEDDRRRRNDLLNTVNLVAGILLRSEINEFEQDLQRCVGMIAKSVDVDRVYIWRNHINNGKLHCAQIFEWSGGGEPQQGKDFTIDTSYGESIPRWEEILSHGECISGLVSDMPPQEQAQLSPQGILSIFVMPVFVRELFWGFIGYDDCHNKRTFPETEQSILRSSGIIVVNAILRHEITMNLQATADKLEVALARAMNASHTKSRFLANTSHEMRTPLNAIIGLSQLALEAGGANEDVFLTFDKIYNAGITLLSTVNDILDISKIEAGKLELVPVEYDMSSLIIDTVTQTILRIGEKPVQFILNIDENLPSRLYGDDLRVKQIINNLLSNAFKYTREGEVVLGIHCIQDSNNTVWMDISVRDTGIGISQENIGNLFADYSMMDMESNRTIEGTGLGLSITKKLIELMEGSITVESEYGKGSVFTARICQKAGSGTVIGPDAAKSLKEFRYSAVKRNRNFRLNRSKLPHARVLVVDDNVTNLDVTKGMLRLYGMQVDCVTSGQMAIDAVREKKQIYNAIFMDHMMPEMDGIEAVKIIRKIDTEYAKNVPIIALTANAIVGNREMFLNKGFQAFLSKPIETASLNQVVQEWVWGADVQVVMDEQESLSKKSGANQHTVSNRWTETNMLAIGKKIPSLDIAKGIQRFGGKAEVFFKILRSYAVNARPLIEAMKAVNQDNLADYAITVHGIKGSSRGISADTIGARAEVLEDAAKAGDFSFINANNPAFLEIVENLVTDIEEALGASGQNQKLQKDKPDAELISRLLAACKHYDIEMIETTMAEIETCEYKSDDGLTVWLRKNVEYLNYEQIIERLSVLINNNEI